MISDVDARSRHLAARQGFDGPLGGGEPAVITGADRDMCALGRQFLRHGQAQAARAARDQRDLVLKP